MKRTATTDLQKSVSELSLPPAVASHSVMTDHRNSDGPPLFCFASGGIGYEISLQKFNIISQKLIPQLSRSETERWPAKIPGRADGFVRLIGDYFGLISLFTFFIKEESKCLPGMRAIEDVSTKLYTTLYKALHNLL